MSLRSRVRCIAGRTIARYPRQLYSGGLALPWALFAAIPNEDRPSFALYEVLLLATVGAALIVNTVNIGFSTIRIWWRIVALYTLVVNFGLADFSYIYWNLSSESPAAFSEPLSRIDSAYLSLTTFTTTGFGDVVPRSQLARLLMTGQMALTFIAVAAGVAVLVAARPASPAALVGQQPEPP